MTSACRLLFAYGTLMSAATGAMGRAERDRLARESAPTIHIATTPGRLYCLGSYPGLVLPAGADEIVHGAVFELVDPARSFAWLDAYEGIVPGDHPHNEYERTLRPVTLEGGEQVEAWVYVFRQPVRPEALIAGGRWLARA